MSDGWLDLENEQTGGTTRIPDDPDVRATYEGRGWQVVETPEPGPFIPVPVNVDPADASAAWTELVHPETQARHQFPNNPDALTGARDAGWVEPNKDGSIPSAATAKRRAKAAEQADASPDGDTAAGESTDRPADRSATNQEEDVNRG